ncbi:hypothetical protein GUJ93_ZPchr0008g12620 [Zizania palustris]|uniref:Uncharacterized protein n=1 Tax=Zizania palustris TaxID=103762 RepID=A0A8J5QYA0_ZIZPA|nr:hypothetical protein GUJ93_ZPchr0008g12620 [Zizania palustris]
MSVPMALLLSLSLAMAFLAVSTAAATDASWSTRPEDDLLNGLPGQPDVEFRHYAGYVGVGSGSGKVLFYWCSSTRHVRRRCCRSRVPSARDTHRGRRPVKCGGVWKAEGGGVEGRRRRWRRREQSSGRRGRRKRREEEDEQ